MANNNIATLLILDKIDQKVVKKVKEKLNKKGVQYTTTRVVSEGSQRIKLIMEGVSYSLPSQLNLL